MNLYNFLQGFTLVPLDSRINLGGAHYTVATMDYGGWTVPPGGAMLGGNNTSGVWGGMLFEILNTASRAHNFTYDVLVSSDGSTGSKRADGTWSGILGCVQRGEATIGASPFTITLERMQDFTFMTPIWFDKRALVVSDELDQLNENSTYGDYLNTIEFSRVFAPFSWQAWLLVVLATLLVGTLIAFIDIILGWAARKFAHFSPRMTMYELGPPSPTDMQVSEHGLHGRTVHTTGLYNKLVATIELCIRLITYHDAPYLPVTSSAKLLFVAWALTCVIITAIYPANLFSLLTLQPRWKPPFTNLATMYTSGYYLIVERGSSSSSYLDKLQSDLAAMTTAPIGRQDYSASSKALEQLLEKSRPYFTNGTQQSYDFVRGGAPGGGKGKRFALLDWNMDSRDHQDSRCDLHTLLSFDFGSGALPSAIGSIAIAHGHDDLKQALDNTIATMWQQGIIPKLYREVHTLASWLQNGAGFFPEQCTHGGHRSSQQLKLSQVQSIFWLLCSGVMVAVLVLIGESFACRAVTVFRMWQRNTETARRTKTCCQTPYCRDTRTSFL